MNACDLPPAAETVVAVTRAVTLDEESRDVRAGVLRSGPEVNFFDHQPLWQVDLKIHLPQ